MLILFIVTLAVSFFFAFANLWIIAGHDFPLNALYEKMAIGTGLMWGACVVTALIRFFA